MVQFYQKLLIYKQVYYTVRMLSAEPVEQTDIELGACSVADIVEVVL